MLQDWISIPRYSLPGYALPEYALPFGSDVPFYGVLGIGSLVAIVPKATLTALIPETTASAIVPKASLTMTDTET